MTTFGDRLRLARNALGLTQDDLADLLDVSKSAVSAWENNRETPAFDKLPRLRSNLRVSLDDLVCAPSAQPGGAHKVAEGFQPYAGRSEVISRDEQRLLRRFRALGERRQKALITFLGEDRGSADRRDLEGG